MRYLFLLISVSLLNITQLYSQNNCVVKGSVIDSKTKQSLPGAHVFIDEKTGVMSDETGNYSLTLPPGTYNLNFQFVGYQLLTKKIKLIEDQSTKLDIELVQSIEVLQEIVVSAEKEEQKLSHVTVSMSLLKPARIIEDNTTSLDQILNKMSGINILDGQPSIRGGGGYSYGAGSRVLALVDGLPLMSADAEDIKWDFLPIETTSQVEIIKGASSVLYGSSAMNGVVNLRTKSPGADPETMVQGFGGFYLSPKRKELIWWDSPRWFAGASFSHARKIKNLELTVGANIYKDKGYRENEYENRGRVNFKLNHRSKKVNGLAYGVNLSAMFLKKDDFFLWQNADSGAYRQNIAGTSYLNGFRLYVDPHISYFNQKGAKHSLKTRYFKNTNDIPDNPDKSNQFDLFLGEYKYQKKFSEHFNWTVGAYFNYSYVRANLFGDHSRTETALFTQLNGSIVAKLLYSVGFRWETYSLNKEVVVPKPVFRAGLNYQALPHTFIRISAGQGFRFPSIAEKYASTQVGALNIFPNPDLESETGWSAEIGVMQGYKFGNWTGFFDFAFFRNEYVNMIEYTFGAYPPDSITIPGLEHIGFKALNVGKARITGIEAIINASREVGKLKINFQAGYTFLDPVDLTIPKSDTVNNILKYRFRHSVKGDVNFAWEKWGTGATLVYNSFMERVDSIFIDPVIGNLILPGYPAYRQAHQKGSIIFDYRISWNISEAARLSFIIKNLFNTEYLGRPGDILPHRSITLQFLLKI